MTVNGYRETEIGTIPAEWKVARLQDIALDFFSGGTPSTKNPKYYDGNIHWTTSAHINESLYLSSGLKFISQLGLDKSSSKLVPQNNLLIGTRVGVGKVAINTVEMAISQDLTGLILDCQKAHLEFAAYAIRSGITQKQFQDGARGTTIKGIPREDLKQIGIPLPPLDEQRRIAAVLTTIQQAIAAQEQVIQAARELKRSLMHRLFTYGPYAEERPTKETEFGDVPDDWEIIPLA